MASNLIEMASNLLAMASNLLAMAPQPTSNGLQPTSGGLQPNSDVLLLAMASISKLDGFQFLLSFWYLWWTAAKVFLQAKLTRRQSSALCQN